MDTNNQSPHGRGWQPTPEMMRHELTEALKEFRGPRPSFQRLAEFLNSRQPPVLTARGCVWNGQSLYQTLQRYGIKPDELITVDDPAIRPASVAAAKTLSGAYDRVRKELLAWAYRWTLTFPPNQNLVVTELNKLGSTTVTGKPWRHPTLACALQTLGYQTVRGLLEETDWVAGQGRMTEAQKDALRRKLRGEDDEPEEEDKYERMRREGYEAHAAILRRQTCLDDEDAEWLAQYDGVSVEGVILRSYDLNPSPEGAELQSYDLTNLAAPVDEEGYPAT